MTHQGQTMCLRHSYVRYPTYHVGVFPLDEELALLADQLTPRLHVSVVRLDTWMPFAQAPEELAFFIGVRVS